MVGTVVTQELISVLNQVSDDLHRSCFSLKAGFKKKLLTQELILVLNLVSQKYCLDQFFFFSLFKKKNIKIFETLQKIATKLAQFI